MDPHLAIETAAKAATDRFDLWSGIANRCAVGSCAEIGVFRGEFAEHLLRSCPALERYFMVDPWRHLEEWNKPANVSNEEFVKVKQEALTRTEFASAKRVVLQGRTTEVARQLPPRGLDLAYIDGDHSLRGITLDLLSVWPAMKDGGILGGDDFCASVWQHDSSYEPTLVFPLAVYFAEARDAKIYGLPFNQFAIVVDRGLPEERFEFRDLTGSYGSTQLREALLPFPRPRKRPSLWGRLRRRLRQGLPAR